MEPITPSSMSIPSKEQLKGKYQISNDDFQVLTELPTDSQVKERQSFLILLASAAGAQEWMWKTLAGTVLAIIIISLNVSSWCQTLRPIATYTYDKMSDLLVYLGSDGALPSKGSVVLFPGAKKQDLEQVYKAPIGITVGSSVFPVSGSWRV
jgi:hypothetical protein